MEALSKTISRVGRPSISQPLPQQFLECAMRRYVFRPATGKESGSHMSADLKARTQLFGRKSLLSAASDNLASSRTHTFATYGGLQHATGRQLLGALTRRYGLTSTSTTIGTRLRICTSSSTMARCPQINAPASSMLWPTSSRSLLLRVLYARSH